MCLVTLANLRVGLLLAYGTHDAEAADVDKAAQWHLQGNDGVDEVLRALGVDAAEVSLVQTLGNAGGMHHIVEVVTLQLLFQLLFRRKVQLDEVDALVGQELA